MFTSRAERPRQKRARGGDFDDKILLFLNGSDNLVGSRVEIRSGDEQFYAVSVLEYCALGGPHYGKYRVQYDDGETQFIDFEKEEWRPLSEHSRTNGRNTATPKTLRYNCFQPTHDDFRNIQPRSSLTISSNRNFIKLHKAICSYLAKFPHVPLPQIDRSSPPDGPYELMDYIFHGAVRLNSVELGCENEHLLPPHSSWFNPGDDTELWDEFESAFTFGRQHRIIRVEMLGEKSKSADKTPEERERKNIYDQMRSCGCLKLRGDAGLKNKHNIVKCALYFNINFAKIISDAPYIAESDLLNSINSHSSTHHHNSTTSYPRTGTPTSTSTPYPMSISTSTSTNDSSPASTMSRTSDSNFSMRSSNSFPHESPRNSSPSNSFSSSFNYSASSGSGSSTRPSLGDGFKFNNQYLQPTQQHHHHHGGGAHGSSRLPRPTVLSPDTLNGSSNAPLIIERVSQHISECLHCRCDELQRLMELKEPKLEPMFIFDTHDEKQLCMSDSPESPLDQIGTSPLTPEHTSSSPLSPQFDVEDIYGVHDIQLHPTNIRNESNREYATIARNELSNYSNFHHQTSFDSTTNLVDPDLMGQVSDGWNDLENFTHTFRKYSEDPFFIDIRTGIKNNDVEHVKELLKTAKELKKALTVHIYFENDEQKDLMELVVLSGWYNMFNLLLKKGPKYNFLRSKKLLCCAILVFPHPKIIRGLLNKKVNPNQRLGDYTALHLAVAKTRFETVKLLVQYDANVLRTAKNGVTPFHIAVQNTCSNPCSESKTLMHYLCEENTRVLDMQYDDGKYKMSALSYASLRGYTDVVDYLLKMKANPNLELKDGKSLFQLVYDNQESLNPEVWEILCRHRNPLITEKEELSSDSDVEVPVHLELVERLFSELHIDQKYTKPFNEKDIRSTQQLLSLNDNELRKLLPVKTLRKQLKKYTEKLKDKKAEKSSQECPTSPKTNGNLSADVQPKRRSSIMEKLSGLRRRSINGK